MHALYFRIAKSKGLHERFWSRVDRSGGPDACWEWQGSRHREGYGLVSVGNVTTRAHRVAYALTYGYLGDDELLRHSCDNPPCCNPAHLVAGNHGQNMEDRSERDRVAHLPGEANVMAKLSEEDVRAICARVLAGESTAAIAEDYKVSRAHINGIARGRFWPHLGDVPRREKRANNSPLTADQMREIRRRRASGESRKAVAAAFGIAPHSVQDIVARRRWADVPD